MNFKMINFTEAAWFKNRIIKSGFFLAASLFCAAAANANCPDAKELYLQQGVANPRWITDSGWISDVPAQVAENKPILARVYIVEPPSQVVLPPDMPKPIHALLCSYSNSLGGKIIFNMIEPFGRSNAGIVRSNLEDWFNELPVSQVRQAYYCLYGVEHPDRSRAKCEFRFGYEGKSNDVQDYQSPFDE